MKSPVQSTGIGKLTLPGKAWLAPMAGVSDVAFRVLCTRYGAAASPTEFLSSNALARNNPTTVHMAQVSTEEHVKIIQIFGQNEANIAKTTQWITQQGCYDCIDINLGCPSPKILMQGAGSALLRRPHRIADILKAVLDNTHLPVSVKIRTGMTEQTKNALEILQLAQDLGINHCAIHGRTVSQGYSGKSDWDFIKLAVQTLRIPVIANGDIVDGKSAKECLEYTGAAGVMVGRAARGNPFVFADINAALNNETYEQPSPQQQITAFFEYLELYKAYNINDWGTLKQHAMCFTKGIQGGAHVRRELATVKDIDALAHVMQQANEHIEVRT